MSANVVTYIMCDACNETMEHEYDLDYAEERWVSCGGMTDIEVGGDCYEHMCESCWNDVYSCEWCENGYGWEGYSCGDFYMVGEHDTCIEEYHEQLRNDAAEEGVYIGRECDCGYTYDGGVDAGGLQRPIIKLVYTHA